MLKPEHTPLQGQLPPQGALFQLLFGYSRTQLIYVAARLGLADLLHEGPRSSHELAQAVGADEPTLQRVLRGLSNIGVFAQDDDGHFSLTPLGDYLRTDAPGSLHGWAIFSGEVLYQAWTGLLHSVQTGETAFDHVLGSGVYDFLARNPEYADAFSRSMSVSTEQAAAALLEVYDFATIQTVVDVGGGHGTLLTALLRAHPALRGILFDMQTMADGARQHLEQQGLSDRCSVVAGDFFDAVPSGGDLYILSWVLLDWDDEHARRILQRCRAAMPAHGRLLLLEALLPDHAVQHNRVVGRDLSMLVMTGGQERTAEAYRALLAQAGFEVVRILPTRFNRSVIEALPRHDV